MSEKIAELARLADADPPDVAAVQRLQAEIAWFYPDAYAAVSAFEQAVQHAQALRAAGGDDATERLTQAGTRLEELESASPRDEAAIAAAVREVQAIRAEVNAAVGAIAEAEAADGRGSSSWRTAPPPPPATSA